MLSMGLQITAVEFHRMELLCKKSFHSRGIITSHGGDDVGCSDDAKRTHILNDQLELRFGDAG